MTRGRSALWSVWGFEGKEFVRFAQASLNYAFCAFFFGCANSVSFPPGDLNSLDLTDSAVVFRDGLYSRVLLERCGSCHTPSIQAPYFANTTDIQAAHDVIVDEGLVDFLDASGSRLSDKVRRNHNCWGLCVDNAAEIETEIARWSEGTGRSGVTEIIGYKSASIAVPANLTSTVQTLEVSLEGAASAVPAGALIQFRISKFDSTYKISHLGLFASSALYFQTMRVYINGRLNNPNSSFSLIDITSEPRSKPSAAYPLMGSGDYETQVTFDLDSGPGLDTLMFVFDTISTPLSTKDLKWAIARDKLAVECNMCHGVASTVNKPAANGLPAQAFTVPSFGGFTHSGQFVGHAQGVNANNSTRLLVVPGNPTASSLYRSIAHGLNGANYPEIPQLKSGGGDTNMASRSGMNTAQRTAFELAIREWIETMDDP